MVGAAAAVAVIAEPVLADRELDNREIQAKWELQ